jgi:hypothetical protein
MYQYRIRGHTYVCTWQYSTNRRERADPNNNMPQKRRSELNGGRQKRKERRGKISDDDGHFDKLSERRCIH